jgi:transposase InsO family protein
MPWKEVKPMDQRLRFISDYLNDYFSITELCNRFGISRTTGYKWINRYQASGRPDALFELSKRPHHSPNMTADEVVQALLTVRDKHPFWGPRKLLCLVAAKHPEYDLPAESTVALILKRHGYIKPRRKRIKRYHPGRPLTMMTHPNVVWTADFKGHFKTLDGLYCYPLTIADGYSRYLFSIDGMLSPLQKPVKTVFKSLFEEYGLPEKIRTDNGNPFATVALGRLSRLSAWWIRLGIIPELIEPGCPEQNGRHERMHKTLKYETTVPPAANLKKQQQRFDAFRQEYNHVRPHEALDMKAPVNVYQPSCRKFPSNLPQVEYPAHYELRRVSNNCGIRWKHKRVCVSQVLAGEYVGLEEIDDGVWDMYYGPVWLGRFFEKLMKIEDEKGKLQRHQFKKKAEKCKPCL